MSALRRSLVVWSWLAVMILLAGSLAPSPGRAARPSPPPLRFDRGGHARIPFDLRLQHVWLRGRLNGADSVWIVVDTGAASSVVDDAVARSLGLTITGHHEATGAGGLQAGSTAENLTIELPGLTLHRRAIDTTDLSTITQAGGRPMQLVLGYELFRSCIVRFDYNARVMDVWDVAHAPETAKGVSVPMTLAENHPYVEAELRVAGRSPVRGRFVLDTGSTTALLIAPDVAQRESLLTAFPRTLVSLSRGVGGEIRNRVGRADAFALGGLTFLKPLVIMPDAGAGRISVPGSVGNIGGLLLGRCRVTFDYPHHTVHFEPGPGFERPFEADKLGAVMVRGAQGFEVRWVDPSTPAADAGLEVGDLVTRIDDQAAETVDPAALRVRFLEEGRVVRLEVRRGSESKTVSITLRRLI